MHRRLILSLVLLGALTLTAAPAWAHTAAAVAEPLVVETLTVELRAADPSIPVLPVALAMLVVLAACASRRRIAVALLLLTAVIGFNAALHSVHHLDDTKAGATCVLASSTVHAPAVLSDAPLVAAGLESTGAAAIDATSVRLALAPSRPDRGRAPPSSAA